MKSISVVSAAHDADIIVYSGGILHPFDCKFVDILRDIKRRQNLLLVMTTSGGSADAAYRMMRHAQHYYEGGKIFFMVIDQCKSAGTLMAIGADEIIMVDDSELGPLDVQVMKPDEVGEYTSGLTAYQALTALRNETFQSFEGHFLRLRQSSGFQISTKTAADIAAKLATGGTQKLYDQIDPMRLAEYQRAMTIADRYGIRLDRGNLKGEALERLIAGFPSHGFLIDFKEAKTLFKNVRLAINTEVVFAKSLLQLGLCSEGYGHDPMIVVATRDFQAIEQTNKPNKRVPNEIRRRQNGSKATTGTGRGRIPLNGAGHSNGNGSKNGRSSK